MQMQLGICGGRSSMEGSDHFCPLGFNLHPLWCDMVLPLIVKKTFLVGMYPL